MESVGDFAVVDDHVLVEEFERFEVHVGVGLIGGGITIYFETFVEELGKREGTSWRVKTF